MEIIIGSAVSLLIQFLKERFKTREFETLFLTLALSVIGATAYLFFVETGYIETVVQVLTTAGAFYAFILRRLED